VKRIILFAVTILVIGIAGIGCIEQPSYYAKIDEVINYQQAMNQEMDIYQQQINNKIDAIMSQQREIVNYQKTQYDYTQMLISEMRKSNQTNSNIMKIDISIDRGGYGEVSSFNNIDDAVKFINTFR